MIRSLIAGAFALILIAGCQPMDDAMSQSPKGQLTGTVWHRERIALPDDARVEVRLEDVSVADAPAAVLAEQSIETRGAQVPIPFELRYDRARIDPRGRYAVRASILSADGTLLFTSTEHHGAFEADAESDGIDILVRRAGAGRTDAASGSNEADDPGVLTFERDAEGIARAFPETGRTYVFDCAPGISFTVRTGPGEIALWAPETVGGEYTVLGAAPTGDGTRYEDGDDVVVLDGDSADFRIAGQQLEDCQPNQRAVPWADAARRGVTFRAIGNEPAWHLEVFPTMLAMTTNLGASRVELAFEEPLVESLKTTYRASGDGHDLVVVIERTPCVDTMSGEPFDAAATVTFDGETFRGCGRFL